MAEPVVFDPDVNRGVYINVYLVDQRFGGPEEGGWWYLVGDPIESVYVPAAASAEATWQAAQDALAQKQQDYDTLNATRRPLYSVLSEGVYEVRLEDRFAEPFPTQRPFYE